MRVVTKIRGSLKNSWEIFECLFHFLDNLLQSLILHMWEKANDRKRKPVCVSCLSFIQSLKKSFTAGCNFLNIFEWILKFSSVCCNTWRWKFWKHHVNDQSWWMKCEFSLRNLSINTNYVTAQLEIPKQLLISQTFSKPQK